MLTLPPQIATFLESLPFGSMITHIEREHALCSLADGANIKIMFRNGTPNIVFFIDKQTVTRDHRFGPAKNRII
jgi:hypothetical protein